MNELFQIDLEVNDVTHCNFQVTKVGENLYRLEEHPIFSEEVNYKKFVAEIMQGKRKESSNKELPLNGEPLLG